VLAARDPEQARTIAEAGRNPAEAHLVPTW
jgi:hypothetical protein